MRERRRDSGTGPSVTVVRVLARRGDRVLMLRRAAGDSLGGCLEFPGGKIDRLGDGRLEAPVAALRRELREEAGVELAGRPRLVARARHVSPKGKRVSELLYEAQLADGDVRLSDEHDECVWHSLGGAVPGKVTDSVPDGLAALVG
jgi:8-oxo-dGTP pyrophosphatase MutT (NUDIX family)